jgi:hypothetical protein
MERRRSVEIQQTAEHDAMPLLYPVLVLAGIALVILGLLGIAAISGDDTGLLPDAAKAAPVEGKKSPPMRTDMPPTPSRGTGPAAG